MHRYLMSGFWSLLMTYWHQVRPKLHNNHTVFQLCHAFCHHSCRIYFMNVHHQLSNLFEIILKL